ncbi:MAG: PLP-dependent aminotransferase family protein [Vicinamibacteria bacterium]
MTRLKAARRPPAQALLVRIDAKSRTSLQQQIYDGLRRAIVDGVLAPGARVPSSRELARDLGVSRTTTLLASEQLLAEGYLAARHGSGTFVAGELPDDRPSRRASPAEPLRHPPLSRRGAAIAAVPPTATRPSARRPFQIGVPAVDLFPVQLWARLVSRRLASVTAAELDYGKVAGYPPLREAIADYVASSRGTRCAPEQVHVTTGAQSALGLACTLLLDAGDRAWMEEPGYPGARSALTAAGARIVSVPVDQDGLDVAAGVRKARDARMAIVTPSHQFPLGVPMSVARRQELLAWARAARAWVVEDDYDSEFRYGSPPLPCLHGLDPDGRVVYVGSFAKNLFPALRLGFLIVPPDLEQPFRRARLSTDVHSATLEQVALAEFIARGHFERHLRRMRSAYRERLQALSDAAVRRCAGALRLRPIRAGLHVAADLVGASDVRVADLAAERGVDVMPLSSYYFGRGPRANGLVLGFGGVRPDGMDAGMQILAASIDAARRPL